MEKISTFNAQTGKKKEVSYIAGWIKEANERMHTHKVFCVFQKDLSPYYISLYV